MRRNDFTYDLPERLYAKRVDKENARLLVLDGENIEHRMMKELPEIIQGSDIMFNNALNDAMHYKGKVIGDKEIRITAFRYITDMTFECIVRPTRIVRGTQDIYFQDSAATLIQNNTNLVKTLRFIKKMPEGELAIPEFMEDNYDFTTDFGTIGGSILPPDSINVTKCLIRRMQINDSEVHFMHHTISPYNFKYMKWDDLKVHVPSMDYYEVPVIKKPMIAGDLCSLRGMQIFDEHTIAFKGYRSVYLKKKPKLSTGLLTQFYPSRSIQLVFQGLAFGHDRVLKAYEEAVKNNYRFLSAGDNLLIL